MPTASVDAEALRRRAQAMRRLADAVSTSEAIGLRLRAGPDVWIGPTATLCSDGLARLGRNLTVAADDLLARARSLERRAAELDLVAAIATAR